MTDNAKPTIAITCKCGASFNVVVPDVEMFFNIMVGQIILISNDPKERVCPKCGLTWAPRFRGNIPLPELFKIVEWVAFQQRAGVLPPTLGDVRKFG